MKARRILHEKTQRFLCGWSRAHLNLQGKWRPGAFYVRKHNDFFAVGGALRRRCILIRNRDGDVHVLTTCTHVVASMFDVTERSSWIAFGAKSKNASLEPWKITIHKATWIRKIWCSMCIDGNGADLVTVICSQVWGKPVKSCTDSLRNVCPEKVMFRKCLPLRRNGQNWHSSMTLTEP